MITHGAPAADVTATMLRVTASSGIRNVSAGVTLTEVSVSYMPDDGTPFTRIRAASGYVFDYAKLDACEAIAQGYATGKLELQEARAAVERLNEQGRYYSSWLTAGGWALMGGSCALFFGAGWLVVLCAALSALSISYLIDLLTAWKLPYFFVQVTGAFLCVIFALLVNQIDPAVNSSLVVVACIVMLLAGLTSVGAMQDAITGWYVTAAARLLETFMLTIGLVIGIRAGLIFADAIGADISINSYLPATFLNGFVVAIAGCAMGLGYAVAVQVPPRLLIWVTALSTLGATLSFVLGAGGFERSWAVGITATLVGLIAVLLSHRVKTPIIILIACAVIPMVPGSTIYRGLLGLGDGMGTGYTHLLTAAQIAIGISAGAVFGQFIGGKLLSLISSGRSRLPIITAPFSTNRRRRMVSFGRKRRLSTATTTIPVVSFDPSILEPDPTTLEPLASDEPPSTPDEPPSTPDEPPSRAEFGSKAQQNQNPSIKPEQTN